MPTPAPPVRPDDEPLEGPQKSHSHATAALLVGILGLFVFGIVLGPLAIYLGVRSRRDIEASHGQLTGSGKATAAIVLGAIATAVWVIFVIATIAGA